MAINPKDTAPIRQEERFDEARLADYLRRHVEELDEAESISFEQFPGGHANLTYLARAGDQEFVVRRPPLGPVAPRSHDMVREHRVLARLHRLYPLAPRAIHLCTDETVMGKPFFVMERRRGFVIREDWPDGLADTPDMRARAGDSLIEALVDLHRVEALVPACRTGCRGGHRGSRSLQEPHRVVGGLSGALLVRGSYG